MSRAGRECGFASHDAKADALDKYDVDEEVALI
jgi:hypothetical protein